MDQHDPSNDPVPAYQPTPVLNAQDTSLHQPDISALSILFFSAIRSQDTALVTTLLDANPTLLHTSDPDTPGLTPLYAATVGCHEQGLGKTYIVALLAQRGAPIDELSSTGEFHDRYKYDRGISISLPIMRTPLMAAASLGSLPLVKLLMEDLNADDGVIAPDGEIALRLAVRGKHRDIIDLLPARRRGGFKRFQHSHRRAVRRIKKAGRALYECFKFFAWTVPKFFLWTVPKFLIWDVVKTCWLWAKRTVPLIPGMIANGAKKAYQATIRGIQATPRLVLKLLHTIWAVITSIAGWIWKTIKATPRLAIDFTEFMWGVIKKTPSFCWRVVKRIAKFMKLVARGTWHLTKELAMWFWKLITVTIPQLLLSIGQYIVKLLSSMGRFTIQFLSDLVSFIDTVFNAIITRLKSVTLADIGNAFKALLVSFPLWVWGTLVDAFKAIERGIMWTLKQMGDYVTVLVWITWSILTWIPEKVAQIAVGTIEIAGAGVREVWRWVNPKTDL